MTAAWGQLPSANFTASPLGGCSPLVVNFQDQSTGKPTAWLWDFGNGNTSTLQNPIATYFNPGSYTVKLTVTNASGKNTLTRSQYITVYAPPTVNFGAQQTSGCFPLRVQFTDSSTAGPGNSLSTWQWDFGDGTTSTQQSPQHTYTAAGNFTVTLKVTNDKGCTKVLSRANLIRVTPGVTAGFSNSQPTVCQPPAPITFTNSSTGSGTVTYTWKFGDGNTSTLANPVYTYTTSGTFTVTLVAASSNGCADTLVKTNIIAVGTNKSTIGGPDSLCVNDSGSFSNTSLPAPVSSSWTFGDGGSSTQTNPVHAYTTPGTYTIKLINNFGNCRDSVTKAIRINARPVVSFTAQDSSKCQPPFTVNFKDLTPGAAGWFWNFGDGTTSSQQNPSHTYTSFGTFDVTLVVTNRSGCSDTLVRPSFIKIQQAQISIPGLPAAGCVPFTLRPSATVTAVDTVTSWLWDFGDGTTSSLKNPVHTYPTQGTYTVSLVITTSTGCTDTLIVNNAVRVGTKPVPNFTQNIVSVCAGRPVAFKDQSVPSDQWSWDFGDGSSSSLQNPTHYFTTPGTFNVTLTAFNNGCPASITKPSLITVNPPVAKFNPVPNCANRLQFSFQDQSTGALTWLWDFGDGTTSTLQNPTHTFPALGKYVVTLTVTNGACSSTLPRSIFLIQENPDFVANPQELCKGATTTFQALNVDTTHIINYRWNTTDRIRDTAGTYLHAFLNAGTYTVSLITTDINGCRDTVTKPAYIRVDGPKAKLSATNNKGCQGLTVTFNDLSTTDGIHPIQNWHFKFGDGTVQDFSAGPFTHTYTGTGTYTVTMTVTDASGCSDSVTVAGLVVTSHPVANFKVADTLSCPGATVSFQGTSTSALSYNAFWDFGNGSTATTKPNASAVYAATGSYTVKLRITDANGCSDSLIRSQYIRVDKPVAGFTVSDSASSCAPFQVQFTNTSQFYSSSSWTFGTDGSSTLTNPVHYFGTAGTYPVSLVVTSHGGCRDSVVHTIRLYDTLGSALRYSPLAGCNPKSISFSAVTPGPATYLWDYGDGVTQTTTTPSVTHVYSTFGDFHPKVILQDPTGCLIPITGADTIRIIGSVAKFGLDRTLLCDSGRVQFSDSTTYNDSLVTWNWRFGDGTTSGLQNPQHLYANPGVYSVTLITQTQAGCRDTATLPAALQVLAGPRIRISGDSTACVNATMDQAGIILRSDSTLTWAWSFPNGQTASVQDPPAQLYTTAGQFTVQAIVSNSTGCRDTARFPITVFPLPSIDLPGTITMLSGSTLQIPATYSTNVATWMWSPGTGLSCVNCPQPEATPKYNTTYTVDVKDSNSCRNSASVQIVVLCKNANIFVPNTFSPNGDGSNDVFYPRGTGIDRIKLLRIFNRWGQVVFEKLDFPVNDASQGWDGRFHGKNPQPGVYVYQIEVYCSNGDLIKFGGNVSLIQ